MYNSSDSKSNDLQTNFHLLISGIVPRPIAFVGTKDKNGNDYFSGNFVINLYKR